MIWNPGAETLPRRELTAPQLERLRTTLRWASERIAFYREAFAAARFTPESIRTLDDLQRIPFTVKAHLREHYPFGLFAAPLAQVSRIHASSGTGGKPTVVAYTKNDLQVWREVMARSLP